jgi:hypothetical protein
MTCRVLHLGERLGKLRKPPKNWGRSGIWDFFGEKLRSGMVWDTGKMIEDGWV